MTKVKFVKNMVKFVQYWSKVQIVSYMFTTDLG